MTKKIPGARMGRPPLKRRIDANFVMTADSLKTLNRIAKRLDKSHSATVRRLIGQGAAIRDRLDRAGDALAEIQSQRQYAVNRVDFMDVADAATEALENLIHDLGDLAETE